MSDTIDLSQLPPPDVVETLDYETLLARHKTQFLDLHPEVQRPAMAARLEIEGEPIVIVLEALAYAELLLRQRVNESARQCMLASATGTNLDHLAVLLGVQRLTTDPGDPDAFPPITPTYETDERLRARAQLAVEGMSTAGPVESYRYHALSAHGDVADASVTSPTPSEVVITVLSNDGDGSAPPELLAVVDRHLNSDNIRPLTDHVTVQSAEIVTWQLAAVLTLYPGPASGPVLESARLAARQYIDTTRRVGYDVTRSGLFAALHQPGVQNVALASPDADIIISPTQSAHCTGVDITLAEEVDV
jgi:phage-related baseplate assembly protein